MTENRILAVVWIAFAALLILVMVGLIHPPGGNSSSECGSGPWKYEC